jgi:hypothetical protein
MEKEEHVRIELELEMAGNAGSGRARYLRPGHGPDNLKCENDHEKVPAVLLLRLGGKR